MLDAHVCALLLVLEVLGEGCSEAFGNWGALSSEKSWASFSWEEEFSWETWLSLCWLPQSIAMWEPCVFSQWAWGYLSFLNSDVFNAGLIKYILQRKSCFSCHSLGAARIKFCSVLSSVSLIEPPTWFRHPDGPRSLDTGSKLQEWCKCAWAALQLPEGSQMFPVPWEQDILCALLFTRG